MPLFATTLKPCPAVEGDNVTNSKLALPGDAVNDHVIGGNTHRCGIAVVIEEVRTRTATTDRICADLVQFSGCYAGFRISAEQRQGTCCLLVETVEKREDTLAHFVDRTASVNDLK